MNSVPCVFLLGYSAWCSCLPNNPMSLFPCDLKYVTILPLPPAPSIQRQLMQLLRCCCRWGLWTGAFSAIYVPIHHQTCPQRKMHLWVIQNPHYPHPTPTSARLFSRNPELQGSPRGSWCCGMKQFPRVFCLPFLYTGDPPCCPCRGPRVILQLPTHSPIQSLPNPINSISRISLDSIQFPVLSSLPPASSCKARNTSRLPLPKLKQAKVPNSFSKNDRGRPSMADTPVSPGFGKWRQDDQ